MIKFNPSLVLREQLIRAQQPLYTENERGALFLCWYIPFIFGMVLSLCES